jgi:hypothetical protein
MHRILIVIHKDSSPYLAPVLAFSRRREEKVRLVEKDAIYSMRMSSRTREILRKAARQERRTVASLLDKIISDYLQKQGFLGPESGGEQHRFVRKRISLPARTGSGMKTRVEILPGVILDISPDGILVSYANGSEFKFTSRG